MTRARVVGRVDVPLHEERQLRVGLEALDPELLPQQLDPVGTVPVAVDRLSPETRLAQAREYVRVGNYLKALPLFQQLTFELGPSQPELAEARYYIGECYFQTRDYVQAIQEYRRTADGFPDSPWAPLALLRAGDANLLVCPNIDAANIAYNLLKTAAGGNIAIGPVLLGAAKPVHVLTASTTVRRIVNMTALTVADANANHLLAGAVGRWTATITTTEAGVVAGLTSLVEHATPLVDEGARVGPGTAIATLTGTADELAAAEDLLLGDVGFASGIATAAARVLAGAGRISSEEGNARRFGCRLLRQGHPAAHGSGQRKRAGDDLPPTDRSPHRSPPGRMGDRAAGCRPPSPVPPRKAPPGCDRRTSA